MNSTLKNQLPASSTFVTSLIKMSPVDTVSAPVSGSPFIAENDVAFHTKENTNPSADTNAALSVPSATAPDDAITTYEPLSVPSISAGSLLATNKSADAFTNDFNFPVGSDSLFTSITPKNRSELSGKYDASILSGFAGEVCTDVVVEIKLPSASK